MDEIYLWLEQYTGIQYTLDEDFENIYKEMIFVDTFNWYDKYTDFVTLIDIMTDCITKYKDYIPDYLPNKDDMITAINQYMLSKLSDMVNTVKSQIGIDIDNIDNIDVVSMHAYALYELIKFIKDNSNEDIIKKELFEKYEDENDDLFENTLSITKQDLSSISFAMQDITTAYLESLEEND